MRRALAATLVAFLAVAAGVVPSGAMSPPSYMVFFAFGSAEISPQGDNTLRGFASDFQKTGSRARAFVAAHTDAAEARSQDMALSPARGAAVKNRLVEFGVPADRIQVWVYGDSQPLVVAARGAEPQNRRADIVMQLR